MRIEWSLDRLDLDEAAFRQHLLACRRIQDGMELAWADTA